MGSGAPTLRAVCRRMYNQCSALQVFGRLIDTVVGASQTHPFARPRFPPRIPSHKPRKAKSIDAALPPSSITLKAQSARCLGRAHTSFDVWADFDLGERSLGKGFRFNEYLQLPEISLLKQNSLVIASTERGDRGRSEHGVFGAMYKCNLVRIRDRFQA